MDNVSINFSYTQKEYIRASRQFLFANRTITKFDVGVAVFFSIFAAVYLFTSRFSPLSIVAATVSVIVILLFAALYFYIPRYTFSKTAKFQEEYFLNFSEAGIAFKTKSIDSHLKWSIYRKAFESPDFLFLVQNAHAYTIIPKRALPDSETLEALRRLIAEHIGGIQYIR